MGMSLCYIIRIAVLGVCTNIPFDALVDCLGL